MRAQRHASVVLTERDIAILAKLSAAGWLTTTQIREYFFPDKSTNAVSKRLRKLAADEYIALARTSSTEQGLYRIAGRGKLALLEHTSCAEEDISIPIQLPRKLAHFVAVNDLRRHFEQMSEVSGIHLCYFFSERELGRYFEHPHGLCEPTIALLTSYKIIPDALTKVRIQSEGGFRELTLAIEYDAGTEPPAFFGRTKIRKYTDLFMQHCEYLGEIKVLTFARGVKRLLSLMRYTILHTPPRYLFYFASPQKLGDSHWATSALFLDPWDFFVPVQQGSRVEVVERDIYPGALPQHALITLPATSPRSISPREESEQHISHRYAIG